MKGVPFLERITIAAFFIDHFTKVRKNKLNAETTDGLTIGDRVGVTFGGRLAATVSLPNPAVRVTDRDVFLAWMQHNFPQGVEMVPRVRPETQRAFIADFKANDGRWLNTETGAWVDIDGIGTGDPVPHVELADNAAEVIGEAWASGEIGDEVLALLKVMTALPGPEAGEPGA